MSREGGSQGGSLPRKPELAPGRLRVGTWNMSGWRAAKAEVVLPEIAADVLALQETHLAKTQVGRVMAQ